MLETENKHLIEGVVMVIFYLEMSFTGKFTLVYFFYHYRTFCMLYILSEIIFQFDFLRYKIVIYMYIYNLILFVWFQILHLYFFLKHFFTRCNSLYIFFYLLPPLSHLTFVFLCHCHMGRHQIISSSLLVKLL